MMMKVAIIGSRSYTNTRKIKDFIHQLKEKFKIRAVPTIILFNNGVKEETYKANIMLQLPITLYDLQKDIDRLYINKF